jgi:hypothetical protein
VFCRHLPSILYRFDVISAFVIAENGRKTISASRGRVRPEVKSPFDYLLPVKSYSTFFDLHVKRTPFENFGERIFRREKNFSSMRPQKGTSLGQSASFEISCMQIVSVVWSVGLLTKKGKVK